MNTEVQRSLVSNSPWGRKELDTTEQLSTHTHVSAHRHTHTGRREKELTWACSAPHPKVTNRTGAAVPSRVDDLYTAGKPVIWNKKPWSAVFAGFHASNTPTGADCKLPT